ncbi:hypothetical protein YC2023_117465 [Brassica napus]
MLVINLRAKTQYGEATRVRVPATGELLFRHRQGQRTDTWNNDLKRKISSRSNEKNIDKMIMINEEKRQQQGNCSNPNKKKNKIYPTRTTMATNFLANPRCVYQIIPAGFSSGVEPTLAVVDYPMIRFLVSYSRSEHVEEGFKKQRITFVYNNQHHLCNVASHIKSIPTLKALPFTGNSAKFDIAQINIKQLSQIKVSLYYLRIKSTWTGNYIIDLWFLAKLSQKYENNNTM